MPTGYEPVEVLLLQPATGHYNLILSHCKLK
jgi:hypothetical protein